MKKLILVVTAFLVVLVGCQTDVPEGMKAYNGPTKTTYIPKEATAIVTDGYCGDLLAINAPVIGCDLTFTSPSWQNNLNNIDEIGQSVEKVYELAPDLIITWNEDMVDQYEIIAPTVYIPYGFFNPEELVLELGKIAGLEDNANSVIAEFNESIKELDTKIKANDQTVTTADVWGEDIYIYGNNWGRFGYVLYDKLKLLCTDACQKNLISEEVMAETYLLLTEELIPTYIGDILILGTPNATPKLPVIFEGEIFQQTSAYINDQIYFVDSDLFYHSDLLSLQKQIEEINNLLEQNNEK